jgi:hypothetical protein
MGTCHLSTGANGNLTTSFIVPGLYNLERTLFELSRTTDKGTHFDSGVHTQAAIKAGIQGHRPLHVTGTCDESELPKDLYFRDAWELVGGKVLVNMPRARSIHLDRIREARDAALLGLDVKFLRAVESHDTVAQDELRTLRIELRDIPETFDLGNDRDTPERLKSRWPDNL